MPNVTTGSTAIKFGSTLRIGYRPVGSVAAYTYLTPYITFNELPKVFNLPVGAWELELTEICPNCSGGIYSNPVLTQIILP